MVDAVPVPVDHGLLEPERVDQEPDQRPGVARPQAWARPAAAGVAPAWLSPSFRCSSGRARRVYQVRSSQAASVKARRRLGRFGTPRPATGSAGSPPARGTPAPDAPDRSTRRPRPGQPAGTRAVGGEARFRPAGAWPGSKRMTRAAAFGVRPISARNRLVRWRPLQPVPAASADTRTVPPARSSCCQAQPTSGATSGAASRHPATAHQPEQDLVQDREPLGPAGRGPDPVAQFGADAAEDGFGGHVESRRARRPAGRAAPARRAAAAPPGCRTARPRA